MTDLSHSRSERVDLRMTLAAKNLMVQAAKVKHKTLTEFVVDSAVNAAIDDLEQRRALLLDDKQWAWLMHELDKPVTADLKIKALLNRKPAWKE